jgi:hypothetical protein
MYEFIVKAVSVLLFTVSALSILTTLVQPMPRAIYAAAVSIPEYFHAIKLKDNRVYEIVAIENTLRFRDVTDPKKIDVYAVDSVTGDIHFFVNASVDNRNPNSFLYGMPPAYRLVNGLTNPYKVVDWCFRNDGIVAFRLGDPHLDGQETVDVVGFDLNGKVFRNKLPQPQVLTTPPPTPWQPDPIGSCILYITVAFEPPSGQVATITIDMSRDSANWVNIITESQSAPTTRTLVVYVPSSWYVRWSLSNSSIQKIVVFYV